MVINKVDSKKRLVIPQAKPGQYLSITDNGDGSTTLTPVKPDTKEPFPPGSLLKYMTKERDADMTAIAKATIIGVPKGCRTLVKKTKAKPRPYDPHLYDGVDQERIDLEIATAKWSAGPDLKRK
jgi:hypothetical protein